MLACKPNKRFKTNVKKNLCIFFFFFCPLLFTERSRQAFNSHCATPKQKRRGSGSSCTIVDLFIFHIYTIFFFCIKKTPPNDELNNAALYETKSSSQRKTAAKLITLPSSFHTGNIAPVKFNISMRWKSPFSSHRGVIIFM